ncbi:acetylornithine transaminase [Alkalicoccobacillus murimartini]|uniref:Acetylornithine aminotransferase n=1 Tax=Alkalicoccobacillus murimartini TaxID=171685 RepID=A0ABT9YJA1_9BACI|nr:acetylornithine transaminase [Alkalicoccobacillus murimartini]MDQ0207934.1 acetylornithine aminotransferase [Alkalicoccobacillus murimartini]
MSSLFPTYQRWELSAKSAKGCTLVDTNGKEYLDFVGGIAVCNLGHCHPNVVDALVKQAETLWHVSNLFQIEGQEKAASVLAEQSSGDYVFFCNSGTEANEAAIKLARKHTGKNHIISLANSFHGRTLGSMAATGQSKIHEGFGTMLPSFTYAKLNDIQSVQEQISSETAAIMIEVVQGEGGVRSIDQTFATQLKELCEEHELLLIVDEVQTGIGRTGKRFGYEHFHLSPDIITVAKGLGNGFPVGAMIGKEHLKAAFQPGSHGSTFGGNPLAMAVVNAVLETVFDESFLAQVEEKGKKFQGYLQEALQQSAAVKEIRSLGLITGIECHEPVAAFITKARELGLLVLPAGPNVIRILPPLVVTEEELQQAANILAQVVGHTTATVH